MASVGMDRETGRILRDFDHVVQSIADILTTGIGERILREWYGFPGFRLFGEPMNQRTMLTFFQLCMVALTMRQTNGLPAEPRFRVTRIVPLRAERSGNFTFRIDGEYLPRGHLGDFTPVGGVRRIRFFEQDGRFLAVNESGGF